MTRVRYVVSDWVTGMLAIFLFDCFRFRVLEQYGMLNITLAGYLSTKWLIIEQILIPIFLLFTYWISGYYNNVEAKSRLQEFTVTIGSSIFNALCIYFIILTNDFFGRRMTSYELLLVLILLLFSLTYIGRLRITSKVIRQYRKGLLHINTIIAGNPEHRAKIEKELSGRYGNKHYNIIGLIPVNDEERKHNEGCYMDADTLRRMSERGEIDQVIISSKGVTEKEILNLLSTLFAYNVPIRISPGHMSFITSAIHMGDVMDDPFIDLTKPRLGDFSKNIKRMFDVVFSSVALIILSPLMAVISIKIKMGDNGPIFYSQERIGRYKQPFKIYKFRSMRIDSEINGPQLSSEDDPRITPFGAKLRKYRLDELPQFWNVIKGDMSIVGPRPERDHFIRLITERVPEYTLLQQVRPGITSWGMVKYGYAKNVKEMVKRSKFDLIYINNMSLAMDLKIMLHTIRTIFLGKGI